MPETFTVPDGISVKDKNNIEKAIRVATRNLQIYRTYWAMRNKVGADRMKKKLAKDYGLSKRWVEIIVNETEFTNS